MTEFQQLSRDHKNSSIIKGDSNISTDMTKSHSLSKEINPQKLLNKTWISIEMGKPGRNIPGIYMIGIKLLQFYILTLYLGHSKDIRRRLNQHMQPSQKHKQKIDNFTQNQPKDSIIVKWVEKTDHRCNHVARPSVVSNQRCNTWK